MSYTEVIFTVDPVDPGAGILVAELAEIGYESFEETETGVMAYIHRDQFDEKSILGIGLFGNKDFEVSYVIREVMDENWNKVWESAYEPVVISDRIHVRASFHPARTDIPIEILIDPKMSFGTAHHETTAQMMEQLLEEDLKGRSLLDMGCGTAVLAIQAELMGAVSVQAIDIDQNAVENARENVQKNNCRNISVLQGTAHEISGSFDVILANINKNILMQDMQTYASALVPGGVILFSGFYLSDLEDIKQQGQRCHLSFDRSVTRNNWTVARFVKQK